MCAVREKEMRWEREEDAMGKDWRVDRCRSEVEGARWGRALRRANARGVDMVCGVTSMSVLMSCMECVYKMKVPIDAVEVVGNNATRWNQESRLLGVPSDWSRE